MNIGVVIVTYNRKEKLKKALEAYENQTLKPSYIIVVDNNSNDGTNDMLNKWKTEKGEFTKYILNLPQNIGGSGGFYTGLKKGLELKADWIWVSDDDAYPEYDAFEKASNYINKENIENDSNVAAICGQIINNGKTDITHRKRIVKNFINIDLVPVPIKEYNNENFELNLFSYVGTIINKSYLKKAGLPEKDYFIYYDDTEHSYRLNKLGKIICIPSVKIVHDVYSRTSEDVNWKEYYTVRNKLLFLKKHFNSRYYKYMYVKQTFKCILRRGVKIKEIRKTQIRNTQIRTALKDGSKEAKGIHNLYKPGWKISI